MAGLRRVRAGGTDVTNAHGVSRCRAGRQTPYPRRPRRAALHRAERSGGTTERIEERPGSAIVFVLLTSSRWFCYRISHG